MNDTNEFSRDSPDASAEHRRFVRIRFAQTMLIHAPGECYKAEIADLSLGGASLLPEVPLTLEQGSEVMLELKLNRELTLQTEAKLVHQEEHLLGFQFTTMELETFTHLRSLIEANLEDDTEVERELHFLKRNP
ncbi:MAG: PilZ domain-containing protein [bacterium]|jgi:c-di-GMP-binding flagellar brake protein YcgR